jgi:hypothetical protein
MKLSEKPTPAVASSLAPSGRSLCPHAEVDYHSQGVPDKQTSPPNVKVEGHPIRVSLIPRLLSHQCFQASSHKKIDILTPCVHEALLEMLDEKKKTEFHK